MKNKRHARRVKRLALICTMCTIILVVSTYAWFIGMKTVNVNKFDINIASTEGLYLFITKHLPIKSIDINSHGNCGALSNNRVNLHIISVSLHIRKTHSGAKA